MLNKSNKASFGNKLLLQVLSTVILVFGITIFFVTMYSSETSETQAKAYLHEISAKNAQKIKAEIDESITISKVMAFKYVNSLKIGHPLNEKEVIAFASDILKDNPFIVGFWFKIKEKELFFKAGDPEDSKRWYDKTGQFNPYIAKAGDKITINPGSQYGENLEWVKGPMDSGKTYITTPYMYPIDGVEVLMSTVAVPMYNNGEFIGTIGIDIVMDSFTKMAKEIKLYENGYVFIVDAHGYIIGHPKEKYVGKKLLEVVKNDSDYTKAINQSKAGENHMFNKVSAATGHDSLYLSESFEVSNGDNFTFFVTVPKAEYLAHATFMEYFSIIAGLVAVILVAGVIILSVRKLNRNLSSITEGLNDFFNYLNKKSTNPKRIEIKSNDEFGIMADGINENVETVRVGIDQDNALIDDVKGIVNKVGQGYLNDRINNSTTTESLNELKNLLNSMLDNLENAVGKDINKLSEALSKYTQRDFTAKLDSSNSGKIGNEIIEMNNMITHMLQDNQKDGVTLQSSAQELTSNVSVLSENATSQAASIEETAASIDEITSNIEQTSQKAQEMRGISEQTQKSSTEGKNLATDTVKAMDEINEQVTAINEAITVIDQIAFQTNILSLNAAVEAATAGEAGKGFAVVAQEVRNLAARSAEAAKEIKDIVETATQKANNGKAISSKMIEGFSALEEKISKTNDLIGDVTSAASEQTQGMTQISSAINQLDTFTQENAVIAEKAKTIAQETNGIALNVVEEVNKNSFDGKGSVKVERKQAAPVAKRVEPKPIKKAKPIMSTKEIQSDTSNDEWESF